MYTMYAWFETLCTFTTVLIICIVYMDICCGATFITQNHHHGCWKRSGITRKHVKLKISVYEWFLSLQAWKENWLVIQVPNQKTVENYSQVTLKKKNLTPRVDISGRSIHFALCFRLVSPQECSCGQSGPFIWSAVKTVRHTDYCGEHVGGFTEVSIFTRAAMIGCLLGLVNRQKRKLIYMQKL